MKILFLAMSPHGFGETLIGMSLAEQLEPLGAECLFVIEPGARRLLRGSGFAHEVVDRGMGTFVQILIDDVVGRFGPDVIVLADYHTHCGVLSRRYGVDPWFIDRYGLPVIPIDIWEWEKTDFRIDIVGERHYEVSDRLREMPAQLRPVPLAHPEADGTRHARPFRVWNGDERVSARTRRHLRETFGVGRDDRLVMLPTATWQVGGDASYRDAVGRVEAAIPRLLARHLEMLPERTRFLLVGEVPPAYATLPADRVHAIPPCAPARFTKLLGAVDLVLSLNIGAATIGRAVMSGIPAMVLTNRYRVPDADAAEKVEAELGGLSRFARQVLAESLPLYPFRMWPLGFHSFLDPLLAANPYLEAIGHAEVLDEAAVVGRITELLYDPEARRRARAAQEAYIATVRAIPDTPDVFTETLEAVVTGR